MPELLRWLISSRIMFCAGLSRYVQPITISPDCEIEHDSFSPDKHDPRVKPSEATEKRPIECHSGDLGSIPTSVQEVEKHLQVASIVSNESACTEMWKRLATFVERVIFCIQIIGFIVLSVGASDGLE